MFPTVIDVTQTPQTANATTASIVLSSSITAENLLVVNVATNAGSGFASPPAPWTLLGTTSSGVVTATYVALATGSDSLTLTYAVGSHVAQALAIQVSNWSGTIGDVKYASTTGSIDPPSLTMGANTDNLWLPGAANSGGNAITGAPTNYSGFVALTGVTWGMAVAQRSLTALTENPGAFSAGTVGSAAAYTIGVAPWGLNPQPQIVNQAATNRACLF